MYNVPTSERILQMAEPKSNILKPKPFLQRIQLKGKSGTIIRTTGQIDNGAMRNCISLRRWERYGHCLDALIKSNTVISVANTAEIVSTCHSPYHSCRNDWNPLESTGIRWNPLESAGIHWNPLESTGIRWNPLESAEIHWNPPE